MRSMIELLTSSELASVRFFGKTDTPPPDCVRLRQTHGTRTVAVQALSNTLEEADGMATDTSKLPLLIRIADCQNFAILAPKQRVIGALHAGWRGLLAGAIEEHFAFLKRTWDIDPDDVFVAAGPSLCQACAEFSDPIRELPGIDARFFAKRHVDLRAIADDKLHTLGVRTERMERHPDCTRCNSKTYFSYRAEPNVVRSGQHNALVCTMRTK